MACRAQRMLPLLLLAALAGPSPRWVQGGSPASTGTEVDGSGSALTRRAELVHGAVETTRDLLLLPERAEPGDEERRRRLGEYSATTGLWLLGMLVKDQWHVRASLVAQGGKVLHALPGRGRQGRKTCHWLVEAPSAAAIKQLLTAHPGATAALFRDEYKLSPPLYRIKQQQVARAAADEQAEAVAESATLSSSSSALSSVSDDDADSKGADSVLRDLDVDELAQRTAPGCPWPLLMLDVTAPGLAARNQRLKLAGEVKAYLAELLGADSPCVLEPAEVPSGIVVYTPGQLLPELAPWIAEYPSVTWLSLLRRLKTHNLVAGAAVQRPDLMQRTPPPDPRSDAATFLPLWRAGLDGTGQVVGLYDTGLDLDSCYLWDPAGVDYQTGPFTVILETPDYDKPLAIGGIRAYRPASHRKLVFLAFYQDKVDDVEGHGTSVAATIVGSVFNTSATEQPDQATGVAPGAKLAFVDGGEVGKKDLSTPDYLPSIFETMRLAGARVTSNSWGKDEVTYEQDCANVDAYLRATPDLLAVFSAGNEGGKLGLLGTTGSTTSPGVCKNVLSVGGTESWLQNGVVYMTNDLLTEAGQPVDLSTRDFAPIWSGGFFNIIPQTAPGSGMTMQGSLTQVALVQGFDSRFAALQGRILKLRLPTSKDACIVPAGEALSDTVLLVEIGANTTCRLLDAVTNVIRSGAAGAMFFNRSRINMTRLTSLRFNSTVLNVTAFPAVVVRPELALQLDALLREFPDGDLLLAWSPEQPWVPLENVADFSSFGSAAPVNSDHDPRFKPDLVAPGYTTSARADGVFSGRMDQCSTIGDAGTSVAAPVVAGAATLVRQYFTDGFYPTGAATRRHRFEPSAALLKAVLLAGAANMKGVSRVNQKPLAPAPSPFQGFGRLDLSHLPLKGDESGWRMQVVDQALFTAAEEVHEYEVVVDAEAAAASPRVPLVAVLVWQDYQGFPAQKGGGNALVNDLDLTVTTPRGQVAWGNNRTGGDTSNNVEKVRIEAPAAGTYRITVEVMSLFVESVPQAYSLVVLGAVSNTIDTPFNPALSSARSAKPAAPERVIATAAGSGGSAAAQRADV